VAYADELERVLPAELPNREAVVAKAARHLELIEEANQYLNLTRITTPREAAIKHVLDSVLPWHLFADAKQIVDAGTGAGFPGVPLALVLPAVKFTLVESIQKKARFVESAVSAMELPNITVQAVRAEDLLKACRPDIVVLRAVAPLSKALDLFGPALKKGVKLLLYKGPDTGQEIEEAAALIKRLRVRVEVVMTYELPDGLGTRTVISCCLA
jgi:16S rRNA (guanine527-N7)-methyltransferase